MNVIYKFIFTLFFSSLFWLSGISQCNNVVTQITGTKTVNGITVKVTPIGKFGYYHFCDYTFSYLVGYDSYYQSYSVGRGGYRFDFSPPIGAAELNFAYINNDPTGIEHVVLYKNNVHYSLSVSGITGSCTTSAQLSSEGNIMGCTSCTNAGWNGTTISGGAISSITVIDSVIAGVPYGAHFSLAFCKMNELGLTKNSVESFDFEFYPNPLNNSSTLKLSREQQNATLYIYTTDGKLIRTETGIFGKEIVIEKKELPSGLLYFEMHNDNNEVVRGKFVVE